MAVAVSLLGPFEVLVDERPVAGDLWARRDAANLVKLLALRRDHRLHREQVMDLLWHEVDPADAAPRLHKAAHYARKALGSPDAVVLRGEMVALLPGEAVDVDVEDFEKAAEEALAKGSSLAAAVVLDAYPGEPLPGDLYAEWADEPRERLAGLRAELVTA